MNWYKLFKWAGRKDAVIVYKKNRGRALVNCVVNPTRSELMRLLMSTTYGEARAMYIEGDLYAWNADDCNHDQFATAFGIDYRTLHGKGGYNMDAMRFQLGTGGSIRMNVSKQDQQNPFFDQEKIVPYDDPDKSENNLDPMTHEWVEDRRTASNWYLSKKAESRVMYIMRGLPGSGKSTKAEQLGQGGVVLSTDDFFMVNGEYVWDEQALGYAHSWNVRRAKEAAEKRVSPIVIDNTNIKAEYARPYAEIAKDNGYKIEVAEPDTPWKFDVEELARRNSHGVPQDRIQNMVDKWEPDLTPDDIMRSE